MKKQAEEIFRKNCNFVVGYRYEFFLSLHALLDPKARIHAKWKSQARINLGQDFEDLLAVIGNAGEVFPVLASLLPGALAEPNFEEINDHFQKMPIDQFQERILRGLLHSDQTVDALLKRSQNLQGAIARTPKEKQEWLSHIGLYPFKPESPLAIALELLLKNPSMFRKTLLKIMKLYWTRVFEKLWEQCLPQLQTSQNAMERMFHSCSFNEFSQQSLLRIEIHEGKGEIRALRGGYRLRLQDISRCYFLPSAFNDLRFWSAFEDNGETSVYFPCFDPHIALDLHLTEKKSNLSAPILDPPLIFKALGDSTRYAIVSILARSPINSVALAKRLSVSKPTISHHVHLLREAGLLEESFSNGSVELSLKRAVIENLSELTIKVLFENEKPIQLQRTRGEIV
jgi:DNA-binding transcriptional ArsR family regulator